MEMRLEGPDSIAELVREDWAKYQGKNLFEEL